MLAGEQKKYGMTVLIMIYSLCFHCSAVVTYAQLDRVITTFLCNSFLSEYYAFAQLD